MLFAIYGTIILAMPYEMFAERDLLPIVLDAAAEIYLCDFSMLVLSPQFGQTDRDRQTYVFRTVQYLYHVPPHVEKPCTCPGKT